MDGRRWALALLAGGALAITFGSVWPMRSRILCRRYSRRSSINWWRRVPRWMWIRATRAVRQPTPTTWEWSARTRRSAVV